MKKLTLALTGLLTFLTIATVSAQTADELIAKHIEAIGGAEAWKKINSVRTEGTLTVQGTEVTVTSTVLHQKGARQDISVMGMTGYTIVTPAAGWTFMPFQGQTQVEAMTEDMLKESQDQVDAHGSVVDFKTKGHTIEYLGKEDVDGTECFKLKMTQKSGKVETMFLDPKSYLLIKSVSKRKANGAEVEETTTYSNYQKLPEGILLPMAITVPVGPGIIAELQVKKVEVNKPVDEAIFKSGQP
ncbi:MAG: hypothetical protein H7Y27_01125 [Gemmatimonadaceae bacterium]|nr:hypothetical protein [Chitinophagaceae bacterium]